MENNERAAKLEELTARLQAAIRPIDECAERMARMKVSVASAPGMRELVEELKDHDKVWATARIDLGISDEEFRFLTPRQYHALKARVLERERRQAGMLAEVLTAKGKPRVKPIPPKRQEWPGDRIQLASHLLELFEKGELKAFSGRNAVIKYSGNYVIKSKRGALERVKPESCWRSYYQKKPQPQPPQIAYVNLLHLHQIKATVGSSQNLKFCEVTSNGTRFFQETPPSICGRLSRHEEIHARSLAISCQGPALPEGWREGLLSRI